VADDMVSVGLVLLPSSLKLTDESKNRIDVSYVVTPRKSAPAEAAR
jgi:hypothetical protein